MTRIMRLRNLWRDQSVARKLYGVVGIMAVLIALELLTLLFATNTLSAVRAFVGGEGLWSKAQKDAVLEIQNYARTRDEKHFEAFRRHIEVPMGDHAARLAMQQRELDLEAVTEGFKKGQIHPSDIQPMVNLIRRFHDIEFIREIVSIWESADVQVLKLVEVSIELRRLLARSGDRRAGEEEVQKFLAEISLINERLTELENRFSATLGEASRWLERSLMILLLIAVATVESTGLLFAFFFSRDLTRGLDELQAFANSVGSGNFSETVPVRSSDELGSLAHALNKMAGDLRAMNSERQVAERANSIKSLFLASMSHEIRTPLTAMLGFVDLLKSDSLSEHERARYIEIIERSGQGLAKVINDILDISKVEAGKLEIEMVGCDPRSLIHDLESLLRLRCEKKGIRLRFELEGLPELIITDPDRLKQILLNIIGNAIKFTDSGEVSARFRVNGASFICTVKDSGPGIPPDRVHLLFQPFTQADPDARRKFGGTGLGLILARRLAQLMGGDVVLKSTSVGSGSVFEMSVLFREMEAHRVPPARRKVPAVDGDKQLLAGMRILLVEDTVDNQVLTEMFLTSEGAIVGIANNGQEAIEATKRDVYDLVLLDMQMPVMDGYAAARELRIQGFRAPIIALTAHAMKEELEKCLQAGCDDYLCKPFQRVDLIAAVCQYCRSVA